MRRYKLATLNMFISTQLCCNSTNESGTDATLVINKSKLRSPFSTDKKIQESQAKFKVLQDALRSSSMEDTEVKDTNQRKPQSAHQLNTALQTNEKCDIHEIQKLTTGLSDLYNNYIPENATREQNAIFQNELVSDVDPLGGQFHKDYFRDPLKGYSAQFSPRNFSEGGVLEYHHTLTSTEAMLSQESRNIHDHKLDMRKKYNKKYKKLKRSASAANSAELVNAGQDPILQSLGKQSIVGNETRIKSLVNSYSVQKSPSQCVGNWGSKQSLHAELPVERLAAVLAEQAKFLDFSGEAELLHEAHGLRGREAFGHRRAAFLARAPMRGLDLDRHAQRAAPGQIDRPLPPLAAPAAMAEAQAALRASRQGPDEAAAQAALALNAASSTPALGAELAARIARTLRATNSAKTSDWDSHVRSALGMGRQGALVQDTGPDTRKLALHKNDERILQAAKLLAQYPSSTARRSEEDIYKRHDTHHGVDVFIRSQFDLDRRNFNIVRDKQDPLERNTIHYGVPIKQQIDEDVRIHRNKRGERPLEYFSYLKPNDEHLRLNNVYRDLEGFHYFRNKIDLWEWELFIRYRAHHRQRRSLALLHGLEPKCGESIIDRDLRRQKLDQLCEVTAFDPCQHTLSLGEQDISIQSLRQWFGTYVLPPPSLMKKVAEMDQVTGVQLAPYTDSNGHIDETECILSSRYFNKLLNTDAFAARMGRGSNKNISDKMPEIIVPHAQSSDVLRYFSDEEKEMYNEYCNKYYEKAYNTWQKIYNRRRWIPSHGCYGSIKGLVRKSEVINLVRQTFTKEKSNSDESLLVYPFEKVKQMQRENNMVSIDSVLYAVLEDTKRTISLLTVELEHGDTIEMESTQWDTLMLEQPLGSTSGLDPNASLNIVKNIPYAHNSYNYIETQDTIWEENTHNEVEGWTVCHSSDLFPGLVIKAKSVMADNEGSFIYNGLPNYQTATVIEFVKDPILNPVPQHIKIQYFKCNSIISVPISNVLIWQLHWSGPCRTKPEYTPKPSFGVKRYIDVLKSEWKA